MYVKGFCDFFLHIYTGGKNCPPKTKIFDFAEGGQNMREEFIFNKTTETIDAYMTKAPAADDRGGADVPALSFGSG